MVREGLSLKAEYFKAYYRQLLFIFPVKLSKDVIIKNQNSLFYQAVNVFIPAEELDHGGLRGSTHFWSQPPSGNSRNCSFWCRFRETTLMFRICIVSQTQGVLKACGVTASQASSGCLRNCSLTLVCRSITVFVCDVLFAALQQFIDDNFNRDADEVQVLSVCFSHRV